MTNDTTTKTLGPKVGQQRRVSARSERGQSRNLDGFSYSGEALDPEHPLHHGFPVWAVTSHASGMMIEPVVLSRIENGVRICSCAPMHGNPSAPQRDEILFNYSQYGAPLRLEGEMRARGVKFFRVLKEALAYIWNAVEVDQDVPVAR